MPAQTMRAIAEHEYFKTAAPVVTAVLVGSVGYLFTTLIALEKEVHLLTEGHIPAIEQELKATEDELSKLKEKMTEIRIDHSGIKQHIPRIINCLGNKVLAQHHTRGTKSNINIINQKPFCRCFNCILKGIF